MRKSPPILHIALGALCYSYITGFMSSHVSCSIEFHRVNKNWFWTSGCYAVKCVDHGCVITWGWGGVVSLLLPSLQQLEGTGGGAV
jgi:hypothetical protein